MWHTLSKEEVIKKLHTNIENGLSESETIKRQEKFGKNVLKSKPKEKLIVKFIKQFNDYMIIILIIASIVSAAISWWQGENDYIDSIIIIGIVIFNAILGLVQEEKAEKSIEALKKMISPTTKVIRNGIQKQVEAVELVPGDIVVLEAGSYVPADCRLIESFNLKVEESSLTGETEANLKNADCTLENNIALGDMKNLAFMSSIITNGHGKAVVVETGMNTKVGEIANMIMENDSPETPIQKKLNGVSKVLGTVCLVICLVIFVIGIFKKIPPMEMFMTSVGLAVAAIPEGLPAVVTIMLSIGVTTMAKKQSIIRKLPAVETLGSSSVICSDKTGTLTQNKMKVVKTCTKNELLLIELSTMCTDCEVLNTKNNVEVQGEATEIAIVNYGISKGKLKNELYNKMPRISEIPFDSNRKMMTTIHRLETGYRVITKGAPDVLLKKCININEEKIQEDNLKMANKALRVIAVGYKDIKNLPAEINTNTIENNLNFVGLIGMIDPPREGVKEAVKTCKHAGIKTVMITGDHIATAKAIARELEILGPSDKAITGKELDSIPQEKLENEIRNYSVFARVNPEHKVRIVKAWQKTGAVVAMTGDGVNDSPALKNADIGIAMGKNGTDVAKNAADMILADDNFVSIVEAVKQGRTIYDNIKKAIHFLIATNIGEIVIILIGLILGFKSPLLAIQLLWINLVTDSLPAIALGLEPPDKDIMNRKPVNSRKGIFSDGLWGKIFAEGTMIGMLGLMAFSIGNKYYGLEVGRTMGFIALGVSELIHGFNIKSEKSIFKTKFFENKFLIGSFILGVFLQTIVVIVPAFATIFKLVPLTAEQGLITFIISILPIPIIELQKRINEMQFGKILYQENIVKK